MARIRFENGMVVNFDGNPTAQDVEEVAASLGITRQGTQQISVADQKLGVGKSGVRDFFRGAAKGLGSTLVGASKVGGSILNAINPARLIPGYKDTKLTGYQDINRQATEAFTPSNTAERVGFGAEQVGELFIPASAPTKIAKAAPKGLKFLSRVATGTGTMAGAGAIQSGGDVEQTKQYALGGAIGEGIVGPLLNGAIKVVGKTIRVVGDKASRIAFPMEEKTARLMNTYNASKPTLTERIGSLFSGKKVQTFKAVKPTTEAETAIRFNLMGTERGVAKQAERAQIKLWNDVVDPILKKTKIKVNIPTFFKEAEKRIIAETPELSTQRALLEALDSMRDDYKSVRSVSVSKLQDYKKGWAKPLPESYYKGKDITGTKNKLRSILASEARNATYTATQDPKLQSMMIDWGNLESISEYGAKLNDKARSRSAFRQVWEVVADTLLEPVTSFGGNVLYKTGNGLLHLVGKPGLRKVGDIISVNLLKND